jgi:hypothetical protein
MTTRAHRWYRRLWLPLAALPILQATASCDPTVLLAAGLSQFSSSTLSLFVSSTTQMLLRNFPSADVLQTLLGGNPRPFFTG